MAGASFLAMLVVSACEQPAGPRAEAPETGPALAVSTGPVLIECPSDVTVSAEGTVGSLGGSVRLNRHRLDVPLLGVVGPNHFELTDPAHQYMVLDLKGNGQESFGFRKPVSVTIDYSRCTRSNIDKGPLSVWKIDPVTHELLKPMGGTDDKVARTITFTTDSLSVYSLAN